ncbi:MAG: hypothetical protein U9N59_03870, partial [Campylobacterota bacterium]|nr:hypothetical protein [Campylobacterota bacterium]
LKNLEDSESFIKEISLDDRLIQNKITIQNVQNEIIKLFNKYNENDKVDDILEVTSIGVPFDYGNIGLTIILEEYFISECNINLLKSEELITSKCGEDTLNNILYPYEFIQKQKKYKKEYKTFKSQNQIDFFIDEYIKETRDDKIYQIRDQFTFISTDTNDTDSRYIKCQYDITSEDINSSVDFIFKIGESDPISFGYKF